MILVRKKITLKLVWTHYLEGGVLHCVEVSAIFFFLKCKGGSEEHQESEERKGRKN